MRRIRSKFLSLFALVSISGCLDLAEGCETEISQRIFNPGNTLQAVSLATDCGATTSTSYGIRIIENTDTTDTGVRENTVLGSNRSVGFKWLSKDTLLISGADTTSGFTMKRNLKLKKDNAVISIIYSD
jgi:hypothetical protein